MTNGTFHSYNLDILSRLMAVLGYAPAADRPAVRLRGIRNPDGSWRWVWPEGLREPLFLAFYSATTPQARVFALAVQLIFALRLQKLFFRLLPGGYDPMPGGSGLTDGVDFALFTGTPGPYRKAVCCFRTAAGATRFVKLPLTPAAASKVQAEAQALQALAQRPGALRVPEVVAASADFLVQTDVRTPGSRRTATFGPLHHRFLGRLQGPAATRLLITTSYWHTIARQIQALDGLASTRIPRGLRHKLVRLHYAIVTVQPVAMAYAHGDFTPWNCWLTSNGVAAYDLEFALPEAPLLHDLIHFHVQQGLLVERIPAARIGGRVRGAARRYFPDMDAEEVKLNFRLYLLHQISTFALVYDAQQQWHAQVQWLLRGWNDLLTLELAELMPHRKLAFFDLLDYLGPTTEAVFLKPRTTAAYELAPDSDLDILVNRTLTQRAISFLRQHRLLRAATVRRAGHMRSIDCLFQDGTFLSVDLVRRLVRKEFRILDSHDVVRAAVETPTGLLVPTVRHDFEYTWLFYWLNASAVPAAQLRYFEQQSPVVQADLLTLLTEKYGLRFSSLAEAAAYSPALGVQVRQYTERRPENWLLRRTLRRLWYWMGTLGAWWKPGGLLITFSGVDGAGKSTVIEHVKTQLEKQWRKRVVVVRHRPSVLPILSAWKYGKAEAEARTVQHLPRQGTNGSRLSSVGRFAYYYLDYLVGQVVIWLKHTSRGHIVLYDRYYFDFIHDGRRSNIDLPIGFTQALYALVAKPRLNFFLYAAPEVIRRRKQELPSDTIHELTGRYLQLFRHFGTRYQRSRYVPIENHDLQVTLNVIGNHLNEVIR